MRRFLIAEKIQKNGRFWKVNGGQILRMLSYLADQERKKIRYGK